MRLKLSIFVSAAAIAAGTTVLLANAPASAIACPPGTRAQTVTVKPAGRQVTVCVPYQQCDPAACPSTAPPQS